MVVEASRRKSCSTELGRRPPMVLSSAARDRDQPWKRDAPRQKTWSRPVRWRLRRIARADSLNGITCGRLFFHPRRRDLDHPLVKVNFIPPEVADLAAATGG